MIRQELNPVTCKLDEKQIKAGTSMSVPIDITDDTLASSLVPVQCASLAPPALFKKGEEGRKKKEVLHLSRCYTHTHTRQSRGNPERQEEEKSGHTTGRRPKTAQGGRGTDGPPEPTYTAKRT